MLELCHTMFENQNKLKPLERKTILIRQYILKMNKTMFFYDLKSYFFRMVYPKKNRKDIFFSANYRIFGWGGECEAFIYADNLIIQVIWLTFYNTLMTLFSKVV